MDFNSEVRKSLKTKEELRKEAEEAAAQEAECIENEIAEENYQRLKNDILLKAQNGEAVQGKIFGILALYALYDETGHGSYRNLFEIQEKYTRTQSGGLIAFHYTNHVSWEVKNIAKLDAVYAKMLTMAQADGIILGEPFLRCIIRDMKTNSIIKETRCERKFGKLSAKLRYVNHKQKGSSYGEKGHIELAVEYAYRI